MTIKSSAHYQRLYRQRLREQGLVKKEVWILPQHAPQLNAYEKRLRSPDGLTSEQGASTMANSQKGWSTKQLFEALISAEAFSQPLATLELIDGIEPALHLVMHEYGDLPLFVTVSGEQIIVESVLWQATDITDPIAFNEAVLRTHKYFPLSTISLNENHLNGSYYSMFGALSARSLLQNIVLEIDTLANNVIQATEAYGEFLNSKP